MTRQDADSKSTTRSQQQDVQLSTPYSSTVPKAPLQSTQTMAINEEPLPSHLRYVIASGRSVAVEKDLNASSCILLRQYHRSKARARARKELQIQSANAHLEPKHEVHTQQPTSLLAKYCISPTELELPNDVDQSSDIVSDNLNDKTASTYAIASHRSRQSQTGTKYHDQAVITDCLYVDLYRHFERTRLQYKLEGLFDRFIQIHLDRLGSQFHIPAAPEASKCTGSTEHDTEMMMSPSKEAVDSKGIIENDVSNANSRDPDQESNWSSDSDTENNSDRDSNDDDFDDHVPQIVRQSHPPEQVERATAASLGIDIFARPPQTPPRPQKQCPPSPEMNPSNSISSISPLPSSAISAPSNNNNNNNISNLPFGNGLTPFQIYQSRMHYLTHLIDEVKSLITAIAVRDSRMAKRRRVSLTERDRFVKETMLLVEEVGERGRAAAAVIARMNGKEASG